MVDTQAKRKERRKLQGTVISDKMNKTAVVEVRRLVKHPRYEKRFYRSLKVACHDENNQAKEGDLVEIMETRPLSKTKRWRVVRVLKAAEQVET